MGWLTLRPKKCTHTKISKCYQTLKGNAVMYAVETIIRRRHEAERLDNEERKIIKKILGPK